MGLDSDYLIASGGDDNALVVSLVRVDSEGVKIVKTGSCLCAHSTEITGTCNTCKCWIYTQEMQNIFRQENEKYIHKKIQKIQKCRIQVYRQGNV